MEERERLERVRGTLMGQGESPDRGMGDSVSELSAVDQHPADLGNEMFEAERDQSLGEQVESELADVERALHKLDDGTYGTCEACGKPIGDERLAALPATRFCVEDQARIERTAQAG